MQGLIESVASQFHQGGKANDLWGNDLGTWKAAKKAVIETKFIHL